MAEESKLPSSMLAKKDALTSEQPPAPAPAPAPTPVSNDTQTGVENERVSLSKAEFNDLQAKADKVKAAEARLQMVQGDMQALEKRLTEVEKVGQSNGQGADSGAPSEPALYKETPLSAQQQEDFEADTLLVIDQVANNVFAKNIAAVLARVASLEAAINTTVERVQTSEVGSFTTTVRTEVAKLSTPEDTRLFDKIVNDTHWVDFLQAEANDLGDTYETVLRRAIDGHKLTAATNVFKAFHEKYLKETAPKPDGYAGAVPSGNSVPSTRESSGEEVLNYSERQSAHKRYLAGDIEYAEFEKIKKKFEEADREGRVNYEK